MSGFGVEAFVTSNPLSASRWSYRGVRSVSVVENVVVLHFLGGVAATVFPRELFPDDAIALMRAQMTAA